MCASKYGCTLCSAANDNEGDAEYDSFAVKIGKTMSEKARQILAPRASVDVGVPPRIADVGVP